MYRAICVVIATAVVLATPPAAARDTKHADSGDIRYEVIPVGPPIEPGAWLEPTDLNNRGEVVGTGYVPAGYQFVWDCRRGRTEVPALPHSYDLPQVTAISGAGQVFGSSSTGLNQPMPDPRSTAFVWDRERGTRQLLAASGPEESLIIDANRFGFALGTHYQLEPYVTTQFVWNEYFGRIDLPNDGLYYEALNDWGILAGYSLEPRPRVLLRSLFWNLRRSIELPADSYVSSIAGINDRLDVTGTLFSDGRYRAFLARANGEIDVFVPSEDAPPDIAPSSINNRRQIVGTLRARSYSEAFIWEPSTGLQDLTQLVTSTNPDFANLQINDAVAINDLGWIAVRAFDLELHTTHAYLLVPVKTTDARLRHLHLLSGAPLCDALRKAAFAR
jgi:hypothetical protein